MFYRAWRRRWGSALRILQFPTLILKATTLIIQPIPLAL
jgi:hypothetical protein